MTAAEIAEGLRAPNPCSSLESYEEREHLDLAGRDALGLWRAERRAARILESPATDEDAEWAISRLRAIRAERARRRAAPCR